MCITVILLLALAGQSINYLAVAGRDLASLYVYSIIVDTTSDWVRVEFNGTPRVVVYKFDLLEGSEAQGLVYNVGPSLVAINKEELDPTRVIVKLWLIAVKGAYRGNIIVAKGDMGYVDVSMYVLSNGEFKNYWSYNVSGALEEPLVLEVDYSVVYGDADGTGWYEGASPDLTGVVYAIYYPWYGVPSISGEWIHWNVSDGAAINVAGNPILGLYDSSDPRLIDAHILMAKYSGIDGFIVSWWGIDSFEDRNFDLILDEAEKYGFKVSVYYESYRPRDPLSIDDIVNELTYIIEKYSDSPAYLKVDGKPVIFIYNVEGHGRPPAFWLEVRKRLEGIVGPVYLVGDTRNPAYLHVFDGFHVYIDLDRNSMRRTYVFYKNYMSIGLIGDDYNTAFSKMTEGVPVTIQEKAIFYTVIPGYDDTRIRDSGKILARNGGLTYSSYWLDALSLNASSILITSWNELHEGTQIEPTEEYGFLYLDLTRKYASLLKGVEIKIPQQLNIFLKHNTSESAGLLDIGNPGSSPLIGVHIITGDSRIRFESPYIQTGYPGNTIIIPIIYPGEVYTIPFKLKSIDGVVRVAIEYYGVEGARGTHTYDMVVGEPLGLNDATTSARPKLIVGGGDLEAFDLEPWLYALVGVILTVALLVLARRVTRF